MKICFITNVYGPYGRGGAEATIALLAGEARRAGYETVIISTKPWFSRVRPPTGEYYLGSFYHWLGRLPRIIRLAYHILNLGNVITYGQIKGILRREQPDIVWTHNLIGVSPWTLRAAGQAKRHIHTVHDIQLLHPSGLLLYGQEKMLEAWPARVYRALTRWFIMNRTEVIFPSRWIEQLHLTHHMFNKNSRKVLPNPTAAVDEITVTGRAAVPVTSSATVAGSLARTKTGPDEIRLFLYVGQIEAHKGVELLVRAFMALPSEDSAQLKIIGPGSLLADLSERYMDQRIIWLGHFPHEEARAAMHEADCLVVPSLCYENQPTVILEARAAGLPVMASRLGGIPELLPDDCLFEPTEEGITKALLSVIRPAGAEMKTMAKPINTLTPTEYIKAALV